jgi:hypothetical protein
MMLRVEIALRSAATLFAMLTRRSARCHSHGVFNMSVRRATFESSSGSTATDTAVPIGLSCDASRAVEVTMPTRVPTPDEILAWPATVDVPTAGRAFGVGRDESYRLVREEQFPVPVLRLGRYLRVTRASVVAALGITDTSPGMHSATFPSSADGTRGGPAQPEEEPRPCACQCPLRIVGILTDRGSVARYGTTPPSTGPA